MHSACGKKVAARRRRWRRTRQPSPAHNGAAATFSARVKEEQFLEA